MHISRAGMQTMKPDCPSLRLLHTPWSLKMAPPAFDYSRLLRWCIFSLLVLTSAAVWPTAMDSTIAKGPLFVFGSTCAAALLLSAILRDGRWEIPSRTAMILLGAHLALFAFSAWWSYDPVYTSKAFLFGISSLLVFSVASHAYSSREHVTRLLRAITWLTVGLCTIGMLQYLEVELFSFTFFIGRKSAFLLSWEAVSLSDRISCWPSPSACPCTREPPQ